MTNRGSTQKRRESGDWVALITSHRGFTHTLVGTTEFLRKYKALTAVPKEVQIGPVRKKHENYSTAEMAFSNKT